jgi:hypothetical protein
MTSGLVLDGGGPGTDPLRAPIPAWRQCSRVLGHPDPWVVTEGGSYRMFVENEGPEPHEARMSTTWESQSKTSSGIRRGGLASVGDTLDSFDSISIDISTTAKMVLQEYTYVFAIGTIFALLEAYNNGASSWIHLLRLLTLED